MCAIHQEDVPVNLRSRTLLAAVMGLWMAHPLPAQEPARLSVERGSAITAHDQFPTNQAVADRIVDQLQQSAELHGYRIDVAVVQGLVELRGIVADASQ